MQNFGCFSLEQRGLWGTAANAANTFMNLILLKQS